ncbi:unnamed protein product, partial [Rotaria socialis]
YGENDDDDDGNCVGKLDDVLQLKGTTKNNELWLQIKILQQFYSSNYHLWTQRQAILQQ